MRWARGLPSFERGAPTLHLIPSVSDPAAPPRGSGRSRDDARLRRGLDHLPPRRVDSTIVSLMRDGSPRTFNRMCVESFGRRAEVLFGSAFERSLWDLVRRRILVYTRRAPVRFRLARELL